MSLESFNNADELQPAEITPTVFNRTLSRLPSAREEQHRKGNHDNREHDQIDRTPAKSVQYAT